MVVEEDVVVEEVLVEDQKPQKIRCHNWQLGLVMTAAMLLNLLLAAVMGVSIPLLMEKLGRDPALGSSVMITAITDSGGFFIFLGLATVFLVH